MPVCEAFSIGIELTREPEYMKCPADALRYQQALQQKSLRSYLFADVYEAPHTIELYPSVP